MFNATTYLTYTAVGGFVQVLSSEDIVDSLRGQLMLPERPATFHIAFFTSVALYTLLTKTGLLLIAYLTVSEIRLAAVIGKSSFSNFLPIGFALMCFNTPLGIILSSDGALYW